MVVTRSTRLVGMVVLRWMIGNKYPLRCSNPNCLLISIPSVNGATSVTTMSDTLASRPIRPACTAEAATRHDFVRVEPAVRRASQDPLHPVDQGWRDAA